MKIEKVSDNQIRCTLTREDLIDRELKLSELAYGTEKAKSLFREMMQQASYQFGFEAEDIPLMIEAIPLSPDCIILIITKVEDPEELDTRFSKFSPSPDEPVDTQESVSVPLAGADDILDLFKRIQEEKAELENSRKEGFIPLKDISKDTAHTAPAADVKVMTDDLAKLYSFLSLDTVSDLAGVLKDFYTGRNSLYKNTVSGKYMLLLRKSRHTPEEFNKICNILSEYGVSEKYAAATEAYLNEHCELIIKDRAIQILSNL